LKPAILPTRFRAPNVDLRNFIKVSDFLLIFI
jgi:hypothetical protein